LSDVEFTRVAWLHAADTKVVGGWKETEL
jgi:hypothetical protein